MKWSKVESLMTLKGVRKKQIADVMEEYASRISQWANSDDWQPDLDQAFRLARFLGVPLDYLADDSIDEMPEPDVSREEMSILEIVRDLGIQEARKRLLKAPEVESIQKPMANYRGTTTSPFPLIDPDLRGDDKPTAKPLPETPRRVK